MKSTGLRFYNLWTLGRRYGTFKFTKNIIRNKPINIHNYGNNRNFTYIDDAVLAIDSIYKNCDKNFEILMCKSKDCKIENYVNEIEKYLKKSLLKKLPLQKEMLKK